MRFRGVLSANLLGLCLLAPAAAFASDELVLKGKVTDQDNKPVSRARIILHDRDSGSALKARSNRHGEFEIKHERATSESLEVLPPPGTGLAQVFVENISGEETKHFIVQLKRGFSVCGRIVGDGKGLKGLQVRAYPQADRQNPDTVHGGGTVSTDGSGAFRMVLTPGAKILEISNKKYPGLETFARHRCVVTADTVIPDLVLSRPDGRGVDR